MTRDVQRDGIVVIVVLSGNRRRHRRVVEAGDSHRDGGSVGLSFAIRRGVADRGRLRLTDG